MFSNPNLGSDKPAPTPPPFYQNRAVGTLVLFVGFVLMLLFVVSLDQRMIVLPIVWH